MTGTSETGALRIARYGLMNLLVAANLAGLLAGGWWPAAALALTVVVATLGDEALGDDDGTTPRAGRLFYEANLHLTLPLVTAHVLLFLVAATGSGPLGLDRWEPVAALQARHDLASLIAAGLAVGLMLGAAAVNVAHELIHRGRGHPSFLVGRWLLAFTLDTGFAIEHVHGHHRHVGTPLDPATARRGETLFAFVVRSTLGQLAGAFRHEADRLRRRGRPAVSAGNLALRGQLMSLALLVLAYMVGGIAGAGLFLMCAAQGKFYLEAVNYIEHYGLVRLPGSRVEARHSWNCDRAVSNAALYNLPRHSHHHMFAAKPFWELRAEPDAPTLPFGYKTMIVAALLPPLWRRVTEPRLADWDQRLASEAERDALKEQGWSARSAATH